MAKYLLAVSEKYRVDTEPEAQALIEEAKHDGAYVLSKYDCTYKEVKQKGEVVDDYFLVTLTKKFCDEKEPDVQVNTVYEVEE